VKSMSTRRVVPSVRQRHLVRTMAKTLTRNGNSLALTIDKPILEATGIDADPQLEISTDGDVIIISPVRSKKRTAKLEELVYLSAERVARERI
jgi:antitoxin MazE